MAASHHRWRSVLASTPITLTIQVMVILVILVIQVMITLTMMLMIFQGKYLNKLQHLTGKNKKKNNNKLQGALLLCRWHLLTKGTVMPLLHGVTLDIITD